MITILRSVKEGERGYAKVANERYLASARYLTAAATARWIAQNGILLKMLGRQHHEEVAKRSFKIVVFLATWKCLTSAHLGLVWESRARFPSWSATANDLIVEVAAHLSAETLAEFWREKLSALPIESVLDVDLVRDFSSIAIRVVMLARHGGGGSRSTPDDAALKWFGVERLWSAAHVAASGGSSGGGADAQRGELDKVCTTSETTVTFRANPSHNLTRSPKHNF